MIFWSDIAVCDFSRSFLTFQTSRRGIVGASITYRLGMLGFLGGPTINGVEDIDLNVGLLDQRAGLEWIQRHITKFGGDPDNVTIYGESAGGASIVMQITAYGGP